MNEIKKCFKCGIEDGTSRKRLDSGKFYPIRIITHHISYNPERIVDCCQACHTKIHLKIREQNLCPLTPAEAEHLSKKLNTNRNIQVVSFYENMMPYVGLLERIHYNINKGNIVISSYFNASHGKELFELKAKEDK